jgi:hypothetical protein
VGITVSIKVSQDIQRCYLQGFWQTRRAKPELKSALSTTIVTTHLESTCPATLLSHPLAQHSTSKSHEQSSLTVPLSASTDGMSTAHKKHWHHLSLHGCRRTTTLARCSITKTTRHQQYFRTHWTPRPSNASWSLSHHQGRAEAELEQRALKEHERDIEESENEQWPMMCSPS